MTSKGSPASENAVELQLGQQVHAPVQSQRRSVHERTGHVHTHASAQDRTKVWVRERGEEKKNKKEGSPCSTAQEQTRASDVLGRADAAGGVRLGELCAGGVEDGAHHLAGEGPAGEGVDGDAARAEGEGHGAREVVQAGLGRRVGVVLERRDAEGIDAADVLFFGSSAVGVSVDARSVKSSWRKKMSGTGWEDA